MSAKTGVRATRRRQARAIGSKGAPGAPGSHVEAETTPLTATGVAALQELQKRHGAELEQLAQTIAADLGLKPGEGWQLVPQLGAFARPKPPGAPSA